MAEVFYFHVQEDRSIKYKLLEPIMQEDKDVATWRFRIPKALNEIDMSGWSWWFVYVNARGQEFSELLTLTDDIDEPSSYSTADYDIDYGISKFPGSFSFALEAISAQQGGEISGEWHTKTYKHKVDSTLQGNQAEYAETESDIISALMQEVRNKVNQLVGGATPEVKDSIAEMTDHKKIYVLSTDGNWYRYNGTTWVSGGQYASGVTIDPTLSQTGQAADAKVVGDALASLDAELIALRTFSNTGTDKAVWATNAVNLSADSDYYFCLISYAGVNTEGLQYIVDIRNVYTSGSQLSTKIATAGELVKIRLDPSRTYTRTNIAFNRSADNPSSSTASSWTYAIFKGIPNRSRIADTLRNVALYGISAYTWENIAYYPTGAGWATTPDRISVRDIYPAQNLDVRAKDGYIFTVNYFDGNGNYLSRALNVTHHTISADSHAGLTVYHADNSAIAPEDAQNAVILTYVAGEFGEHRYSGEKISLKKHSISMEQIAFTVPNSLESYGVMQAGDMFGGTYAQAYGNYLQLYDFTAGTLSAGYPMNGGHANSMAFSSDYYSQSDEYPLLYVGAFNSPTVYVNRITTNGVSLVDTLTFPQSQTGYCTNVAIDPINKHLYMQGYSANDPSQVSGNNIIVSKWDLGTVTDNGDNTHSPAFVKSFTLPVITYMQDCKFHDGKIFALCGIGSDYPTKVYVIDVTGERIANIIDSFTTAISNSEKESIVINENDDYMLIGGFNGFYKIHF